MHHSEPLGDLGATPSQYLILQRECNNYHQVESITLNKNELMRGTLHQCNMKWCLVSIVTHLQHKQESQIFIHLSQMIHKREVTSGPSPILPTNEAPKITKKKNQRNEYTNGLP